MTAQPFDLSVPDAPRWISPAETPEQADTPDRGAHLLRRVFDLDEPVADAVLTATALGVYEAFLNGQRVGDLELTPGSTSYDRTVHAQRHEVAGLLAAGRNTLDILLSDGWFRGRNSGVQRRDVWGRATAALVHLELTAADGTRTAVSSDEQWLSLPSPVVRADLMTGQTTDFRVDPDRADGVPVRLDAVAPPAPSWSPGPPVRRVEERRPVSLTPVADGVSILDTGQNLSGWLRLTGLGPAGSETVLRFGEHLDENGDLTTAHLDLTTPQGERLAFHQTDRVVADGAQRVFEPRHTVHGFQYVRIEHPGRPLSIDDLTVVVVHSDVERRGWFRSSSAELERLHEAALWSFRGNIVDVPTDCPTRERSGWTGDYQVFSPVATMLYDVDAFSRKWLQSVRDDQTPEGLPAAFSPDSLRIRENPELPTRVLGGAAGWGDALVLVPWTLYRAYGDPSVLAESWESMRAWVEYALGLASSLRHPDRVARSAEPLTHERFVWDGPFHYGEWLEPKKRRADGSLIDPMAENPYAYMSADRGEVGTAYLHLSARTLARAAEALGDTASAVHYDAVAERVKDAWQREFLSSDGRTRDDTQAAYVRALAFGLLPVELVGPAAARLAELVNEADDRLSTGFLSSGLLLGALADHGHAELAYRLLLRHGTPSWLGMLDRGATTVWEDWDGIDEHGHAHESLNHYSKGAVIRFLHEHVVGLRQAPGSSGWTSFVVKPVPGGGLDSAGYTFRSPLGEIVVDWTRSGGEFTLDLTVPPGSEAVVELPDGSRSRHGAGSIRLTCPAPR
ncbi:alpha-L-rhamnosidase [Herbiconiux sp. VKM Ac-2851]|uniref:alpha-L-rhamnosidase n=1 Tax=Herbiconiux sp. VKM Ac-2851 TaxID=2739025 RepID=UPI0015653FEC|nr:alpha-L-rhamnosidase [Herbiconiux sp. VKM Ac-2851]NQX34517.1 family 78 glycoside hydrolase catalytic domain [Herbiconiux sp. VKM Ac-2851]